MSLKFSHQVCYMLLKCIQIKWIWKPFPEYLGMPDFPRNFLHLFQMFHHAIPTFKLFLGLEHPIHYLCPFPFPYSSPLCYFFLHLNCCFPMFIREQQTAAAHTLLPSLEKWTDDAYSLCSLIATITVMLKKLLLLGYLDGSIS